jgi:hypothetical protein
MVATFVEDEFADGKLLILDNAVKFIVYLPFL